MKDKASKKKEMTQKENDRCKFINDISIMSL